MISTASEHLAEEVRNLYGIEIPEDIIIKYLESDPNLTPESLYDLVLKSNDIPTAKLKGYKFIDFDKNVCDIPNTTGVYIWILKDDSALPTIKGVAPSFKCIEINGSPYRVLYVGLAKNENLTDRIIRKHLKGNPRSSTLCYSIAAILGLPLYGKVESSGKRKIQLEKEYWKTISDWLRSNCYLMVKSLVDPKVEESKKIALYAAPLNIMENPNRKTDPYLVNLQNIRSEAKDRNHTTKSSGCMSMLVLPLLLAFLYMFC